jgi:PAS domain S-box-containing protein
MPRELKILIVEDVPADADAIERELRSQSIRFSARRLETRAAFLAELEAFQPDVILSDFTLPEFDALEALNLLQTSSWDAPFILVTGTRSEEVAVECIRHGADDYILKASLTRLPSSIRNALRKKEAEREKMRTEAALRHSEEQFRLITENSRDLISLIDLDGHFLYASPSYYSGLGYTPESLAGTDSFALVHPDDRAALRQIWHDALQAREGRTTEFRVRNSAGECRVLEASGNWIFDASGRPQRSVIVSRDVTKRKETESALRSLPRLIRDAQEAERRRVARELHDSVVQILSSVKFRMQSVEETLAKGDPDTHLQAAKAGGLLEKAIHEVRRISRNLRPSELDDLGLAPAVRSLCAEFQERTGLPVGLAWEEVPEALPDDLELNLYRIIQEALANIERHAQPRRVDLAMSRSGPLLHLVIRDDGRGLDREDSQETKRKSPGMGLVDIRERAAMMGGVCALSSRPGQGLELTLEIPLPPLQEPKFKNGDKRKKKKN